MKTITLDIQVPDWVEWIAMDENGYWCVFSDKPVIQPDGWWMLEMGMQITLATMTKPAISHSKIDWQTTLRKV